MLVLRDIVVPVDFELTSLQALVYARDLAQTFGARLHVLHVLEDTFALPAGSEGSLSECPRLAREAEDDAAARLGALLTADDRRGGALVVVRLGAIPAATIVSYAEDIQADVIVMGTHGQRGPVFGAMGSVAARVIGTASCPVLTMRHSVPEVGLAKFAGLVAADAGGPGAGVGRGGAGN
jgi:nucleotide-binding universal stress UspA family protein